MRRIFICLIVVSMLLGFLGPSPKSIAVEDVRAGFVTTQGNMFVLDGKPFFFAGANSYDLFTRGDGSNTGTPEDIETKFMNKAQIDNLMSQMASDGIKVVRTWGFSHETWHGFEPAEGQYSEPQFMLFDYIMESARKNGIKIIIVLENYWEAYGAIDQRLAWEGLPGKTHAARAKFFTDEGCKEQYRNYVKHFVTRVNHYTNIPYKDDPTIFSWELMNEPRYQDAGENSTGITLRAWIDEMAALIKSLDPNHMVSAGIEAHESRYGFGGDEGNPFIYIHQSPYIDFCTAHPYPDEHWANLTPEQNAELVRAWIHDAHNVVGKPIIIEEFNTYTNKELYWSKMFEVIEEMDAAGCLFWEYNDKRLSNFTVMHGDPVLTNVFIPHAKRMAQKSSTIPLPTTTPTIKYGDINGDGSVDSTDYTLMKRYILKIINQFTYEKGAEAADVNGDGNINSTDYNLLKRFILRIIERFPVEDRI
ncbi:MAG: dockerin type I domain-containing protein [Bacillota bacterium]